MKTIMLMMRLISGAGLGAGLLLCSCGKTPEPPPRHAQKLGGTPYGTPSTPARTDTGILQDQKTYQAASPPGGAGGAGAGRKGAASAVDATAAAREMVNRLLNAFESGDLNPVIEAFDADQIKPLKDDYDFLFSTHEAFKRAVDLLGRAAGDSSKQQLITDLRKLVNDKLTIDPVNADTGPALSVVRKGADWKIGLEAPLTEDDVKTIKAYHETLRTALDKLADALDKKQIEGREALYAGLLQAALGQEVDLSALGGGQPGAGAPGSKPGQPETKPAEEPKGEPKGDEKPRPVGP
jgi:hypothetical protein